MRDVDHVEEPSIVMLGAGGWDNRPYDEGTPCPVCGRGIIRGDDNVYCARCDGASPALEARLIKIRVGVKGKARSESLKEKVKLEARKLEKTELPESTRRRIWNGYRGSIFAEAEATNASKEGRDWLISINQCPDWSLVLKKKRWGGPMAEAR